MIYFCSSRDLNWESNSIFHSFEFQKSHWWVFLISSWKGGMNKINYIWILPVRRRHSSCQFLFCLEHIAVIDGSFEKKENKRYLWRTRPLPLKEKKKHWKKTFHERLLWMKFAPQLNYPFPLFNIYHALNHKRDLCKPQTTYTHIKILSMPYFIRLTLIQDATNHIMYFHRLSVIHQTRWCQPFF